MRRLRSGGTVCGQCKRQTEQREKNEARTPCPPGTVVILDSDVE
jgi:hypothetical protein